METCFFFLIISIVAIFFSAITGNFLNFFSPVREREREREILLVGFSFWLFQDVVDALEIAAQQDGRHGTKKGTAGPVEEEQKEEERPR